MTKNASNGADHGCPTPTNQENPQEESILHVETHIPQTTASLQPQEATSSTADVPVKKMKYEKNKTVN